MRIDSKAVRSNAGTVIAIVGPTASDNISPTVRPGFFQLSLSSSNPKR